MNAEIRLCRTKTVDERLFRCCGKSTGAPCGSGKLHRHLFLSIARPGDRARERRSVNVSENATPANALSDHMLTVDRADFSTYRISGKKQFRIVPTKSS